MFFALSYVGRYTLNEYFYFNADYTGSYFDQWMVQFACYLVEGASMGALMYSHMHYNNESTRVARPPSVVEEEEHHYSYIPGLKIIDLGDDQATDSHRLASPNDAAREGPEQARIGPASLNSDLSHHMITTDDFEDLQL